MPPVVLDTPELSVGDILTFDQTMDSNDLRLGLTVRDDNVDDELEVRVRLSVLGTPIDHVCPVPIFAVGVAQRPQVQLTLNPTLIQRGACNRVEVWVSSNFAADCEDHDLYHLPLIKNDVAHATYWIWEMSGNPAANPMAAQGIVTSCQTVPRASAPTMPVMPSVR